jgi:glycine/D-amino acid oxidase-like deaminating enzyme
MTDRCDVVVVGGGIMGSSVALHLLEAGIKDVRLLERDGLFEGTTGAGGGFLAPWSVLNPMHGTESKALPIERYGLDFYAGLHAAGHDIDYRRNGVLWVAASDEAWELVQGMAWTAADPDSIEVTADRIGEFTAGALSSDGVCGGRWLPGGAQIYVTKVGAVLAERIAKLGGVIETRRPVTGIRMRGDRVVGVDTPHGPVDCATVVVAAGAWSGALLQPLGYFLPAVPQITSRIITEPNGVPETLPVLMLQGLMRDEPGGGTVLWVRSHQGGLLWGGMYLTHPRNIFVDEPVPDRLDELPLDGVLENQRVARAATFMPVLSGPASVRVKHGAPCYTADDLALVGPVPGIGGLYVLGGDNEVGVTHGPGFGKALADNIANGSSDLVDLHHWRLDRFGDRFTSQAEVLAGVGEAFGQVLVGEY